MIAPVFHSFPEVALDVRSTDSPLQKVVGPDAEITGVAGMAFTVTATGADATLVHPEAVWVTV